MNTAQDPLHFPLQLKKRIWLPDYRVSPKYDSMALQEGCRRLNTLIQRVALFSLPVVFAVNVFRYQMLIFI